MRNLKFQKAGKVIIRFCQKKKKELSRTLMYTYNQNMNEDGKKKETIRESFINIVKTSVTRLKSRKQILSANII